MVISQQWYGYKPPGTEPFPDQMWETHIEIRGWISNHNVIKVWDIISYPLFADADTGIYPHAASQYHARLNAKRGIARLSVDKFPYPRK